MYYQEPITDGLLYYPMIQVLIIKIIHVARLFVFKNHAKGAHFFFNLTSGFFPLCSFISIFLFKVLYPYNKLIRDATKRIAINL